MLRFATALFIALFLVACEDNAPAPDHNFTAIECELIELAIVYDDPVSYNDQQICTLGFLLADFPFTYLVEDVATDRPRGRSIVVDGSSHNESLDHFQNGDYVIVRGQFEVSEDCYRNHVLGLENEDGTTTFCGAGADVPMRIRISDIEPAAD